VTCVVITPTLHAKNRPKGKNKIENRKRKRNEQKLSPLSTILTPFTLLSAQRYI